MNGTMYVVYIILLVMIYYNIRAKSKKTAIINIVLVLTTIIFTVIYNGSFIFKCLNNYQYKAETISDYENINLGVSMIPYQLYLMILWLVSIVFTIGNGIINIIKRKKDCSKLIKGIGTVMLITIMEAIFVEINKSILASNVLIAYEDGMIERDISNAKFLINLGVCTNILTTNLFILINFKNKKENVSDVKGENS